MKVHAITPAIVAIQVALMLAECGHAVAGEFPDKPVRLIIPFPPGGSNDVLGRYFGVKLSDRLGEQVVIDNRGGANGIIGADLAARSDPDGYTLLMVSTSWVMNAAVRPLPYDVEKSFDPIATLGSSPNCIVVNPDWGVKTVAELVSRAKARPASISYGSTGVGGFNHFGGELFKKLTGTDLVMVPYKGGGPAMIDVMSAQIPMMFSSITQVLPLVRQGRLKIIAVGSTKRSPVLPDIPTVAESGYPDYEMSVWWGFAAPDGVPKPQMTKLHKEITAVLDEPQTKKRLLDDAAVPLSMTPLEFRKMISADVQRWRAIAKDTGIVVR
ncbi:MAG: tripartite tricarboxylate transporter substrate binding protein [Betaproteobacteria bacterium]